MSVIALLLSITIGVSSPDTVTVQDVKADYQEAFHIVTAVAEGDTLIGVLVPREMPEDNLLADFQRENRFFLTYLVQNAIGFDQADVLGEGTIEERKAAFYAALKHDRRFNHVLLSVLDRYLAHKDIVIEGYEPAPRETVTFHKLQNVTLRFFYADSVRSDGTVFYRYCAKEIGLKDFPGERNAILEAFAYSALRRDMENPVYGVRSAFDRATELAASLALSTNPTVKLHRAQGVVWASMARSEELQRMLIEEYQEREAYLPFVLVGEQEL